MRRLGLALLAGLLVLPLTGCGGSGAGDDGFGIIPWPGAEVETGPEPGKRAPNFSLETATGETLMPAERTGAPILLNFFASWCANCREEMTALQAANADEVTVIGIDLREGADTVADLAAETGATFPMALDHKGTVTRAYRVTNLPVTFALDADGTVRQIVRGPVDAESIADLLAAVAAASGSENGA